MLGSLFCRFVRDVLGVVLPCRPRVVIFRGVCKPRSEEFRASFVVEERDIAEDLEFLCARPAC